MTDPLHVAPGIVGFLDAPNHVRIRAIRTERWIGFGRARRVVEHLGALCEYPPSTRPPGLAIYGHSGMGKTMLVEKFRRDHPPAFNSAVGFETSPVLAISLTSWPTERRVYAQLLMAPGVSVKRTRDPFGIGDQGDPPPQGLNGARVGLRRSSQPSRR